MKKFLSLSLLLITGGVVFASSGNTGPAMLEKFKNSDFLKEAVQKNSSLIKEFQKGREKVNHAAGMSELTVNFNYSAENFEMLDLFYMVSTTVGVNNEYYFNPYETTMTEMVATDNYNAVALFRHLDGYYMVVAKNITVPSDEPITFNIAEAKNKITFQPLLPSGEDMYVPVASSGPEGTTIVEPGTVDVGFFMNFIQVDGGALLSRIYNKWNRQPLSNGSVRDTYKQCYVLVNENDFISVYQLIMTINDDGRYLVSMQSEGCEEQEVSNDISDYVEWTCQFGNNLNKMPEPEVPALDEYETVFGYVCEWSGNDDFYGGYYGNYSDNYYTTDKVFISSNFVDEVYENPVVEVWDVPIKSFYNHGTGRQGIVGPQMGKETIGITSKVNQILNNYSNSEYGIYYSLFNGSQSNEGNPWFSYTYSESNLPVFGDNVPITVLAPINFLNVFSYDYVGRYSELRTVDNFYDTFSLKHNGVEIASSYDEAMELFEEWMWDEPLSGGTFEITNVNRNMTVDGLQGTSSCVTNYQIGMTLYSVPVLQMLQMRNTDDVVTDRFLSAEDGVINFAAGAFTFEMFDDSSFSYSPLSRVSLEYAPYGSDDYTSLDVTEVPEKFFMPGYGAFYTVPLSQCGALSEGWYDVRISIENAEGATQVQTISPAFKIGETTTSVKSIVSSRKFYVSGGRFCTEGYYPEDIMVYSIDGRRIENRNLKPGLYIVKSGESVSREMVK